MISFTVIDESTFLSPTKYTYQGSICKSGWISPAVRSTPGPSFFPRITQSVTDFSIVKSWLDFCIAKHNKTCHSLVKRPLTQFRVIDCDIRKIIPVELDIQYLALSYVWGQSRVTEHETNDFISFLPSVLPNVVEDAIQVVKRLGYRYLWVDKYCIRQGDSTDKQMQIQQMGLIYSNSLLTLIDAGSNDSAVGLHGVRLGLRAPSTSVMISGTSYVCVPPAPERQILRSKWYSRGWTYQEATLSNRRLVFCKDQVYFECNGMHCYETMQSPLRLLHLMNCSKFSTWNSPGIFTSVRPEKNAFENVNRHIREYSRRSLTYPQDTLNGIEGVLKTLECVYKSFFYYQGIPIVPSAILERYESVPSNRVIRTSTRIEQFVTGLCWELQGYGRRRSGFPSWSWAGWEGQIKEWFEYAGYIVNTHQINLWVHHPLDGLVEWERFCNGVNWSVQDNSYIVLDAMFLQCKFQYTHESQRGTNWRAVLAHNPEISDVLFYPTPQAEEGDELSSRLQTEVWNSFILGELAGTFYAGRGNLTVNYQKNSSYLIFLVTEEKIDKVAERMGLIYLQMDIYLKYLGDMPIQRRTIYLG